MGRILLGALLCFALTTPTMAQDTGTPPPLADTGSSPPADTGTPPPPADTGTPPPLADTGSPPPPDDTGTPPEDTGGPDTGVIEPPLEELCPVGGEAGTDAADDGVETCCSCTWDSDYDCPTADFTDEWTCMFQGLDTGGFYCEWDPLLDSCTSIFELACDDWFDAHPECDQTASAAWPDAPFGDMMCCQTVLYSYEGHSTPESCPTVVEQVAVCLDRFPECTELDLDWDGCRTFEDLDAAEDWMDWIGLMVGDEQCVHVTSNQCTSNDVCRTMATYTVTVDDTCVNVDECHDAGDSCLVGGEDWVCHDGDAPEGPRQRTQTCCCDDFWFDTCVWMEPDEACPAGAEEWWDWWVGG